MWPVPLMEHLLPRHLQLIFDIVSFAQMTYNVVLRELNCLRTEFVRSPRLLPVITTDLDLPSGYFCNVRDYDCHSELSHDLI